MSIQNQMFIVGAQFTKYEKCKRFDDYQAAIDEAIFVSNCAAGIQIEVRVDENEQKGDLLAACQFGNILQTVQTTLFAVESKAENKFRKHIGKQWWLLIANYTTRLRSYQHRMLNLSEEEKAEWNSLESIQSALLNHLEEEMSERAFAAAKWRYVDCASYKNRTPEKPEVIQGFEDSSIRKFWAEAQIETGRVALSEGWVLHESLMGNIEQFFKPPQPRTGQRTARRTRQQFVHPEPEQLRLFA